MRRGGTRIARIMPETLFKAALLRRPTMGKASKSKRDELGGAAAAAGAASAGEDGYEFKLPKFDEQAFIRREVLSARASFYTLGLGFVAGLAAVAILASPLPWSWGWIAIFVSMFGLRPLLTAMKFPEEVTKWKALIGPFIMMFFTALAVWILGANLV